MYFNYNDIIMLLLQVLLYPHIPQILHEETCNEQHACMQLHVCMAVAISLRL